MAYSNLREDQKKPTAAQVQKGYIEDKERVVFPVYPLPKVTNGRKHTIDGGHQHTKNTVTYYSLPASNLHASNIIFKFVELKHLLVETGWEEHEQKLRGQLTVARRKVAEDQADISNKFDSKGDVLDNSKIKPREKNVIQNLKQVKNHIASINSNADRAGSMLGKLLGPYQSQLTTIINDYMNPSTSFEEEEWECVRFAFCKDLSDATKLMIPLEPYD